ncbi:MAG: hypothetical protein QOG70_2759 [Solirubrobacteraceae bacterium]|jgi:hypothetical protein|nr:hypothetical protein [Solirubrobacteraceae bacterium]
MLTRSQDLSLYPKEGVLVDLHARTLLGMTDPKQGDEPTQKTQPKQGKPIEIPVPKREDFDKLVKRAAQGSTADSPNKAS